MYRAVVLALALLGCGEEEREYPGCGPRTLSTIAHCIPPDGPYHPPPPLCDPLTQTGCEVGEKCAWVNDAIGVARAGCAPDGTANVGEACRYGLPGPLGYDNCTAGNVCYTAGGPEGTCEKICDLEDGDPSCDDSHACTAHPGLFSDLNHAPTFPAGPVGVCDPSCDPLADNDFDGSGAASAKTGTNCLNPELGCDGRPSRGTPPRTGWSCRRDYSVNATVMGGYRHRRVASSLYGCNQGYIPFLSESTDVSTLICVALCKPMNCYAGNCGANNENRLGEAPHRCNNVDRVGTFDTSEGGEHCRYLWSFEIDPVAGFLRSPTSDTVGICFDHSKYRFDSDGDQTLDTPYPPCSALPDGFGSGSALGAADVGCVDTTHAGLGSGALPHRARLLERLRPLPMRSSTEVP